ncbi:MAG: ATP-binding protein [Natronospirillum sp.]|uniref:ATP-binding protein n=1 Tax=Natronospirillum sp. TaxID=2812955 RepID=UPI0025D2D3B0|nr:ATP-binding protein [Natronospirillum sp.]MCH8552486.1 ATP-binding protein [Natronospirillum sp.]
MSRSEHRHGVQVLLYLMAAALPLIFGVWMLAAEEIPLWPGTVLVVASAFSMLVGVSFLLGTQRSVVHLLREHGSQGRLQQQAKLEQERLTHEVRHLSNLRRSLERRQVDQNRAVLQLARQFEVIAGTVSTKVQQTEVNPLLREQLAFLHVIGQDLVELLEVEVAYPTLQDNQFVVDKDVQQMMQELHDQSQLPDSVTIENEDADVSARTDKKLFLSAVRQALVSLYPLSQNKPLQASMISYLHAEMDDVIQFSFVVSGFSINDIDADQWFTHFQLHSDRDGRYLGPGLGMMLLHRYAELLGGTVKVNAELSDQLTVILTLPLRARQDEEEQ